MTQFFYALFGWLPPGLEVLCCGVVFIFFVVTLLHLICFILDLIPFL